MKEFINRISRNQIDPYHSTFSMSAKGDMVIQYQSLFGGLMTWEKKRERTSVTGSTDYMRENYTRIRLNEGERKYTMQNGQPVRLFLNGLIAFSLFNASVLVITEGEKKAFVGCMNGVATVGISGIWNWGHNNKDAAQQKDPVLLPDFDELFSKMQNLKKVVLLFDADCKEGSSTRKKSFASSVVGFQKAIKKYDYDVLFGHIKEELPKGLDDLLFELDEYSESIANDLIDTNLKSKYFDFIRLPAKDSVIFSYFNNSKKNEYLVKKAFYGGQLEEAELCAILLREEWLYNATLDSWMQYKSGKWHCNEPKQSVVTPIVGNKLKEIYRESESLLGAEAKAFNAKMIKLSGATYLNGIVKLIQAINRTSEHQMDTSHTVLNCLNGELNLLTGELTAHNPESLLSKQCKAVYKENADSPNKWLRFLDMICSGDRQMVEFFQTWCGLCLSGLTDWQAFVYAYGSGGNGKSTISRLMLELLADYAITVDVDIIMGNVSKNSDEYKVAKTKGARLVVGTEIAKGYPMNESRIKGLTGGDEITARPIYGHPITFSPTAKYFFFGNHKLVVKGQDDGIWRRIYMTMFDNVIPEAERVALSEVLKGFESEYSGILNWCLEGFQRFIASGRKIDKPLKIKAATDDYKRDSDILADFIDEELAPIPDVNKGVYLKDVYSLYVDFCKTRQEDSSFKSVRSFKPALIERGMKVEQGGGKNANRLMGYAFTAQLPERMDDAPVIPIRDYEHNKQTEPPF
jgi:P4 family phage/plasmid primase-like protien